MSWLSVLDAVPQVVAKERKQRRERKKAVSLMKRPGRGGRPVKWGNRHYDTIRECAQAMGVSTWTIRRKLGLKHDPRKRHDL